MEVYLVRHTETVCEKGICYGQSDVGLLPFESQFEIIKKQIPENAVFYSSPLQRCAILADYLSDSQYTKDSRLMEMHFGDWELKKWDDVPLEELKPWMEDFVNIRTLNGESFTELHSRVVDFFQNELSCQNKPVVLVTHAGVIRSILCHISNLPLKDAFQNKVDFGQVIRCEM